MQITLLQLEIFLRFLGLRFLRRFHAGGGAGGEFFGVAGGVEGKEAGEDFVAHFVGPAVTPGLFLLPPSAGGFGLVLAIEEELIAEFGEDFSPIVSLEDNSASVADAAYRRQMEAV